MKLPFYPLHPQRKKQKQRQKPTILGLLCIFHSEVEDGFRLGWTEGIRVFGNVTYHLGFLTTSHIILIFEGDDVSLVSRKGARFK